MFDGFFIYIIMLTEIFTSYRYFLTIFSKIKNRIKTFKKLKLFLNLTLKYFYSKLY